MAFSRVSMARRLLHGVHNQQPPVRLVRSVRLVRLGTPHKVPPPQHPTGCHSASPLSRLIEPKTGGFPAHPTHDPCGRTTPSARSPEGFHGLITQPSPSAGMRSLTAEGKIGKKHRAYTATPKGLHYDIHSPCLYATPFGVA